MRKMIVALCLLLPSTAVFAQTDKSDALSVFVTNPGGGYSTGGHFMSGAVGLGLQHMFTPRVSGEVAVSYDEQYTRVRTFNSDFTPASSYTLRTSTTPVDLTARYHFLNGSNWKPYVGGGMRLVDGRAFSEVTGGVVWQFDRSLGLRFDTKALINDRPQHNERLYNSLGLSWRF